MERVKFTEQLRPEYADMAYSYASLLLDKHQRWIDIYRSAHRTLYRAQEEQLLSHPLFRSSDSDIRNREIVATPYSRIQHETTLAAREWLVLQIAAAQEHSALDERQRTEFSVHTHEPDPDLNMISLSEFIDCIGSFLPYRDKEVKSHMTYLTHALKSKAYTLGGDFFSRIVKPADRGVYTYHRAQEHYLQSQIDSPGFNDAPDYQTGHIVEDMRQTQKNLDRVIYNADWWIKPEGLDLFTSREGNILQQLHENRYPYFPVAAIRIAWIQEAARQIRAEQGETL